MAFLPIFYVWISQGMNVGNHKGRMAIDFAAKLVANRGAYATFPVKLVAKGGIDNQLWFESLEKVVYACGIEDYATFVLMHQDNISALQIGQVFKKGDRISTMGSAGQSTGPHFHFECIRGKYPNVGRLYPTRTQAKWFDPTKMFFIDERHEIVQSPYSWTRELKYNYENITGELEVKREPVRQRIEPSTRFIDTSRGIIPVGTYKASKRVKMPDYEWVFANGYWVALIDNFTSLSLLPTQDEEIQRLKDEISGLTLQLSEKNILIKELDDKIASLEDEIASFIPHTVYIKE